MDFQTDYRRLKEAYSDKNLNRITGKLIELYKTKSFGSIRTIANKVSRFVPINEENDSRCFSKLVMLYHPDKGETVRKSIDEAIRLNNREVLESLSHILILDNDLDNYNEVISSDAFNFESEYIWEDVQDGYQYYSDTDDSTFTDSSNGTDWFENTFYNILKLRLYGRVDVEFPTYYLEDYSDFELADSGIETLDGIEYCIHAVTLDLAENDISTIDELRYLKNLEEVYLSNNQIGYIDSLSQLIKLRVVDIAGNEVEDITPLLRLQHLEYVNVSGNPVSQHQVDILLRKNIIVINNLY